MVIVAITKCILLKFVPIMPAFCSLLLPSYFLKIMPEKLSYPYILETLHSYLLLNGNSCTFRSPEILSNLEMTWVFLGVGVSLLVY